MRRPKLQKTLADYLAIAVTPVLIMLLTGSLVFFLHSLFYEGQSTQRVRWILFWFVVGSVLVARIAMESGRAYASVFTLGLAGAVSLALFRFVDAPFFPIICLGIVWWCADKLTWDCTLIDDSEDASGEGLLQVAGVVEEAEVSEESQPDHSQADSKSTSDRSADSDERMPLWKKLFLNESERKGKPHAPGLWVVYFSLAALPLFGFGQVMLPAGDATRRFAFQCLLVYVASGLGLLMLTSFLGLRRYLRQRNLQMPTTMALTWVGMGSAIAVGILVVCLILPRPEGEYDVTAMIDKAGDKVQEASDWAFLDDDGAAGEGEGQRTGRAEENVGEGNATDPDKKGESGGTQGDRAEQSENTADGENGQQNGGKQSGEKSGEGEQVASNSNDGSKSQSGEESEENGNQNQGSDQSNGEKTAQNDGSKQNGDGNQKPGAGQGEDKRFAQNDAENQDGEDSGEENSGEESSESEASTPESAESPDLGSALSMVGDLFKWIVYGVIAAVVVFLMVRHWQAISQFLANLWAEFLSLFGRRPQTQTESAAESEEDAPPPRPFSDFSDPFRTGVARRKSPSELVRYTFEALQAWATEHGCPRDPHQTPAEFGQQLRQRKAPCATEAVEVSQLYAQVAYARHRPGEDSLAVLEKLWRKMSV